MKQKVNLLITTIAAAMLALTLASCAPIMENTNSGNDASVTITLPKLGGSSSIRALSEEQLPRLQSETVKFRITFKNNGMTTTRETKGGPVTAIFEIGSEVKITVECLNAKQQVIVRSIEKTITMKSGANSLSFKLSEDGEEIIPENGDDEGDDAPDDPVTEKFAVTYELDGGEWNPTSAPPQPTEYAAGDTVTITANTPTKQGLVFGGWKPSVESLSPAGENFYKKDTFNHAKRSSDAYSTVGNSGAHGTLQRRLACIKRAGRKRKKRGCGCRVPRHVRRRQQLCVFRLR